MAQDVSALETGDTLSPERIAKKYAAALDSVNLINRFMALDSRNQEQVNRIIRNYDHLMILVSEDYWTTENLTPLNEAIAAAAPLVP